MPYYTTAAEVEAEFKDITFTATTNVKNTDVDGFINEFDAVIDSFVSTRYVTPVSNLTQGFTLLKALCRALTANRIKAILEAVKQSGTKEIFQTVRSGFTTNEVMKMLERISSGEVALVGVAPLTGGNDSYTRANDIEPVFEKDKQQW